MSLEEKVSRKWDSHFTLQPLYESCNCKGQLIVRVHGSLARALSGSSICINIWFALPPSFSPLQQARLPPEGTFVRASARNQQLATCTAAHSSSHLKLDLHRTYFHNDGSHVCITSYTSTQMRDLYICPARIHHLWVCILHFRGTYSSYKF